MIMTNFKLNLKGQFNNSQTAVNPDCQPTVNRQSRLMSVLCLLALLTLGVGQMWGDCSHNGGNNISFNNCHFYFNPYYDATNSINKGTIQLAVRKYQYDNCDPWGWYTGVTNLTAVTNTRLYYASTLEGVAWTDDHKRFHGWAIISNSSAKSNGETEYWSGNNSTWYSDFKAYGLNSGNTYLFRATSATKGNTIETTGTGYLSNGVNDLNKIITVKAKVSTNDGNSYSEATSPGTLSASSKKFTAHNTCNTSTSLSSNTITCGYTATTTLTAPSTDPTGYTWVGWYNASGTQQTTSKTLTIYPTEDATYYAYYKANQYTGTINANGGAENKNYTATYGVGTLTITTAPTRTGYTLNGYYKEAGATTLIASTSKALQANTTYTNSSSQWTYTSSAPTLYAGWTAKTYTITLDREGATTGSTSVTMTYDASTHTTITNPTKTGYTFGGYWTGDNGTGTLIIATDGTLQENVSGYTGVGGIWNKDATCTLYAQWTAKTTTLSFSQSGTGYGSGGQTGTKTATYGSDMPTPISIPTADAGYCFMGYYDALEPLGTQYYTSTGASARTWDKEDATATLYAYFKKAEITGVTLNAGIFEPVEAEATPAYVTADPVIEPTPTPYTKLCWELRYSNDNPVAGYGASAETEGGTKPNQVRFLLNGLAAGGYKIHVELRTGTTCGAGTLLSSYDKSFSIASDHIVTIQYKCGDYTLKASTSVGGKPLEWSEAINAADITGYTFDHWEAGEGVTLSADGINPLVDGEDNPLSESDADPIYIQAIYDSKLTAVYTKKRVIYFYNTLGWSNVYVYFYSGAYWDNNKGTGSETGGTFTGIKGQMQPIEEGSPIYYFDAEAAGVNASYTYVSFTELLQENYQYFAKTNNTTKNKVIYRGDYKSTTLPMFVPLTGVDPVSKNEDLADYYNEGYWMNYPENTGYTLKLYSSQDATTPTRTIRFPFSADTKMPLKLDVELNEAATNYYYTIYREDGQVLSADYGMNKNYHSEVRLNNDSKKISIKTTAPGIYTFTLVYKNTPNLDYYISVDYPIVKNDYRILYSDNATWSQGSAHTSGWSHPSDVIRKNTDAEVTQYDTVSFYIAKGDGITVSMKFQYASEIVEAGTITWTDVTGGAITIPSSVVTKPGVYNFIIKQVGTANPEVEKVEPYTGNYYIRTDNAGSTKWDYYRASDHQMTYTEFSMSDANSFGEKYSHYFAAWCVRGTNIKFCVANDYSSCISDTLSQDVGNPFDNTDAGGTLKSDGAGDPLYDRYSANVRFMYNQETNKISRAYVSSSTNRSRWFLVLRGDEVVKDEDGTTEVDDEEVDNGAILNDKENWIYERILYIKPNSRFKLFACYAEASPTQDGAQYFRGAYDSDQFSDDNSVVLIGGTSNTYQLARVVYDFKTNRLLAAWLPSGEISGDNAINADVMIIREHQESARCITFANSSANLSGVKIVYGVMKFNRWILNNRGGSADEDKDHARPDHIAEDLANYHAPLTIENQKSTYERRLYFISFPFNVRVGDIFGFGQYGSYWVLQYYDGLSRAQNGYWLDSRPNWKYISPTQVANGYTLEANQGYILELNISAMAADNTSFWSNGISTVELYFPSTVNQETLKQTDITIPALSDEYKCTINRGTAEGDRRVKDSYWRCIGVPSYNLYNSALTDGSGKEISWKTNYTWKEDESEFPFIYMWNKTDNTLTPQSTSAFLFQPMHAYLTQIKSAIVWTAVSAKPSSIVARQKNSETNVNHEWRLELQKDSTFVDQTYVRMSNLEQVTDTFDFGQDLVKELNATRSNIYTFVGYERLAANSMPLETEQTTIVPLGLNIKTAGEYTFAMPDGTNGVGVTLVDTEANVRTSLSALDYTVSLEAGEYTGRFVLEISPVQNTPTGLEEPTSNSSLKGRAQKRIIDGVLYIVRDGKIFDARGARVE